MTDTQGWTKHIRLDRERRSAATARDAKLVMLGSVSLGASDVRSAMWAKCNDRHSGDANHEYATIAARRGSEW
jgi:hypothetical protein